jgi:hypothetical protein
LDDAKPNLTVDLLNPRKLVSWADMIKLFGSAYVRARDGVLGMRQVCLTAENQRGRPAQLAADELKLIGDAVGRFEQICVEIELESTVHMIRRTIYPVLDGRRPPSTSEVVIQLLHGLDDMAMGELHQRVFAYIPKARVNAFEHEAMFGPEANRAFPSIVADIKEAGNCFASGLYTASVFYAMRIAERGLRLLAKRLRVRLPRKVPLEYGNWNEILTAASKKAAGAMNLARGPRRTKELQFYQASVAEITALKDLYRDDVSHCRKPYDEKQARSALEHTEALMRRLAEKLHE